MHLHYKNSLINYTIQGKGQPLVLLHGFLENSSMWGAIAPELAKTQRVICIDLPGHGASGVFSEIHTMQQMAGCILQVLAHESITHANFVGHSMGGYVILALAKLQPEVINKLVLLNSTPFPDSSQRLANRTQALKLLKTVPDKFISMAITNLFAAQNRIRLQAQIEALKKDALAMQLQGITAAIKGMMQRKDQSQVLQNYSENCTIIASQEDPLISAVQLKAVSEANGNHFKLLPGGHMSTYEHPKLTLKAITSIH